MDYEEESNEEQDFKLNEDENFDDFDDPLDPADPEIDDLGLGLGLEE